MTAVVQPNRKLTAAEVDELVAAYLAGVDLKALGERFGMHRQTVRAHLRRRGVELRSDFPALAEAQIDRAVELYAEGLSAAKVAKQLNAAEGTVRRALLQRGVIFRSRTDRWERRQDR